ncbi:MAG: hypothetical protein AAF772_01970 [Acidobacteriota bacterium]
MSGPKSSQPRLFENPKLALVLERTGDLLAPLDGTPWTAPPLQKSFRDTAFQLFDQPFTAQAGVDVRAMLSPDDAALLDSYGTGEPLDVILGPADGGVLTALAVDLTLGLDGDVAVNPPSLGPMRISAHLGAATAARYRQLRRVAPGSGVARLDAVVALIKGSRLPSHVDLLKDPARGVIHRLEGMLTLDFGLEVSAARTIHRELTSALLPDDAPTALELDVSAAVSAALGFGMSESMVLTVGRPMAAARAKDDWIRVRLARARKRQLSFGASFRLSLANNWGTALADLLEQTIDASPIPQLMQTARAVLADPAAGNWDAIRDRLAGRLGDVVEDLFEDTGWRAWAENDPRVQELIGVSRWLVDEYDGLDGRLRSLLDRQLGKAGLESGGDVRKWLEALAEWADGDITLDGLLAEISDDDDREKAARVRNAIETLSGQTIESLLLDDDSALVDAARAAGQQAKRALNLLGKIDSDDLLERIQTFAKKTGIESVIGTLRNLQSVEDLGAIVNARLQRLAERIVGKAWDVLKTQKTALDALQRWATAAQEALQKAEQLAEDLKKGVRAIDLRYGLDVGFEIDRVSQETALIDVELDPSNHRKLRRRLAKALKKGSVRELLAVLAEAGGLPEDGSREHEDKPIPFRLRACAFSSRRVRTRSSRLVFSLAGLGLPSIQDSREGVSRRIETAELQITPTVAGDQGRVTYTRTAQHRAGYVRSDSTNKLAMEAGLWLDRDARGDGLDLRMPYAEVTRDVLRLTLSADDRHADANELEAFDFWLRDLGFRETGNNVVASNVPANSPVRFAYTVQLPGAALGVVLAGLRNTAADQAVWRRAVRNAAYRWFDERAIQEPRMGGYGLSAGRLAEKVVKTDFFARQGTSPAGFSAALAGLDGSDLRIDDGGLTTIRQDDLRTDREPRRPLALLLQQVLRCRFRDFRVARMRPLQRAWFASAVPDAGEADAAAPSPATERSLRALAEAFVNAWGQFSVRSNEQWPNAMFHHWLLLALLDGIAPDLLQQATGVASLRWQAPDATGVHTWSTPRIWRLGDQGIPASGAIDVRFPFRG